MRILAVVIKIHSSARLYSYGRVNNYDKNYGLAQRWYNKKHPWSHSLPSTTMEPIWWGGKASYKEKTVDNHLLIEWDSANGERTIKLEQNSKVILDLNM